MSSKQHLKKENKATAAKRAGAKPDQESNHDPESATSVEITADAAAESETENGEESVEQQLDRAQSTIKDYWDQIMRLKAEIENNQKRAARDIENAHKFVLRNFAESLLPIVDSMEMGQQVAKAENATLETIVEGAQMTMDMFIQVLEKHGLQQLDPVGEKFDPEQHQAISMIEAEDAESNTVVSVMQKGFLLNDRLVRPAMVVVAK
ncbi:MAG: nucleotide exchange factor GrpE [Gammaproteobacteria bacterium]|nr:nucleotide exchange factor GrpE [Gammaproteobacteria bacterium]